MRDSKIVIYATQHGSTERYARWIAEDCGAELVALENADIDRVAQCKTVIFGGGVYAGRILGVSFIKNNRDLLSPCRLWVFGVGLTYPGDDGAFEQVIARNFTEEERQGLRFCHFPGALDFKKLNFMQRGMLRVLKQSILKKPRERRNKMETDILEAYGGLVDFTNRAYIADLVREVLEEA